MCVEVYLYSSTTAALEGGEWSAARRGRTSPRERTGTHFTGGWVGPRAGLEFRKITYPTGFDPGPSSPQSVAIPTELPGPLVRSVLFEILYCDYETKKSKMGVTCSIHRNKTRLKHVSRKIWNKLKKRIVIILKCNIRHQV